MSSKNALYSSEKGYCNFGQQSRSFLLAGNRGQNLLKCIALSLPTCWTLKLGYPWAQLHRPLLIPFNIWHITSGSYIPPPPKNSHEWLSQSLWSASHWPLSSSTHNATLSFPRQIHPPNATSLPNLSIIIHTRSLKQAGYQTIPCMSSSDSQSPHKNIQSNNPSAKFEDNTS